MSAKFQQQFDVPAHPLAESGRQVEVVMTYEEAMAAVRTNQASPPERVRHGDRTAARRAAWADNLDRRTNGVIFIDTFVREADTYEEAYEKQLFLNRFGSGDPTEWGLDVNASPWWPSDDDEQATDWEIYELWS
jgi:hypothetical protein